MRVEITSGQASYGPQRTDLSGTARDRGVAPPTRRKARRRAARATPTDEAAAIVPAAPAANTARVVSAIAHELRTPLATLHAGLEVLSEYPDLDSLEVRQLVSRLQRGVAWLDCLIENLTTWSAIETGHLLLRRGEGSVLGWIEPAIDLVQPQLARRGQRVRLVCPVPAPVVAADSVRLGQAIVNLLVNAGKYGVPDDEIVLTVEPLAGALRIAVADHGVGIPLAEQEAIFRPHMRGAAALAAGVAGHGLGLSIVKAIVEAHGGEVGVASAPGEGTTCWFTIPRAEC